MSRPPARNRLRLSVRHLAAACPILLAALSIACGDGEGARDQSVTAADSAGLRVVTIAGDPRELEVLRVADTLPLTGAPEDFYSGNPQVAHPLNDGRLLLSDGRSVGVFGADGSFGGQFARSGQGPGEFAFVGALWQTTGDSVWVFDPSNRRLSLFAPSLGFARSEQQPVPAGPGGFNVWAGLRGDTMAVLAFAPRTPPQPGVAQVAEVDLGLWVLGGAAVMSGNRPFSEQVMLSGLEGSGVSLMSVPMGGSAQWRPLGRCMAYGYSDRWAFTLQAPDDSLRLRDAVVLRAPADAAEAITPERREAFIAGTLATFGSAAMRAQFERMYREEITFPDSTPHFARVFTSRDGALWVQRYRGTTTDNPDIWTVVDLNSPRAWRFDVPPGSRLLAVDSARVLIATKDEDDLETQAWWSLPELAGIRPPAACAAR